MLNNKNSIRRFSGFILCALVTLNLASVSAEEVSGYIPGEFDVDDMGSASYMIPLEIPAGIAEVQPKLALNFSSGGGNGLLGQGWSLSGMSAISRCPQTMAQDGFAGTVKYDKHDRFCMDGQRLIPVDQALVDYYTPGREYRTEIDSISRVTGHGGSIDAGPAYFTVNTKAGETLSYGEGTSSSRVGSATGPVLSWGLYRLTDAVGNYYQINYQSSYDYRCPNGVDWDGSSGTCIFIDTTPVQATSHTTYSCSPGDQLSGTTCTHEYGENGNTRTYPATATVHYTCPAGRIYADSVCQIHRAAVHAVENLAVELLYTGNLAQSHNPDFKVAIEYESRNDPRSAFVGGYSTWMGKRIKTIRAGKINGTTFNEYGRYAFEYLIDVSTEVALSRLSKLTKFSGNNDYKSTEFEWTQNTASSAWQQSSLWTIPIALTDGNTKGKFNGVNLLDVNGDGRVDVLRSRENRTKATWLNTETGWLRDAGYVAPTDFVSCCDREDDGTRMLDLDGDGLVDTIRNEGDSAGSHINGAWRNTGAGWGSFTGNYVPHFPIAARKDGWDRGYRLADVNGDGFDDVLQNWFMTSTSGGGGDNGNPTTTTTRYRGAWLNDGNSWVASTDFVPPVELATARKGLNHHVQLVDVNGDGRADFLKARQGLPYVTYLSTPSGWVEHPGYRVPGQLGDDDGDERGGRFLDLNGDGLLDFFWSRGSNESVYRHGTWLNTGTGWLHNSNYLPPRPIASKSAGEDQGARFADVNGDGLVDFIYAREGGTYMTWLNTGNGWLQAPQFAPLTAFANANNGYDRGTRVADVNADGLPDLVRGYGGDRRTWINTYQPARLLKITDGLGKQISVEYKPLTDSSVYSKTLDSSVSYDRFSERWIVGAGVVVAKTLVTNGIGGQNSLSYKYWAGKVDIKGRGMLGFAQKQTTDNQTGTVTTTRYRQDFPYAGRVASVSSAIGSEVISEASFTYDVQARFGGKVYFPYAKSSVERQLEAGSVISEVETHTTYDLLGHGNATNVVTSTTGGSAKVIQTTSNIYTDDPTIWRLGRLTEAKVEHSYDAALHAYFEGGAITKTSKFEYNTLGLLWKEIVEPTSTELGVTLETVYEYDGFGRTTSSAVTGRLSNNSLQTRTTTTAYSFIDYNGEAVSRVVTTNAFSHQQEDYYSRKHGGLVYSKGPNGKISTWTYDNFGRKKREDRHDGTYAEISYGQCNLTGCGVHAPTHAAYFMTTMNSAGGETTVYKDILGRKLRTVSLGFDGRYVFQDTQYNSKGQVSGVSDAYYGGYKEPGYWTRYVYDERGRVEAEHLPTELHPDPALPGAEFISTERIYNGLEIIEFNQLAQGVTRANNVLGKLVSVTEEIGVGSTVNYYYNAAGELLRTVVGSNEKTLTFDIRGRKKTMIDPDMGSWTYTYNAFGELESQTDAKGQTVQFEYDLLGRKIKQTNAQGESTWHYDSYAGTTALGKLIHVTGAEALYQQSTVYDDALRPISSSTSFDSNNSGVAETFVTQLSYDDQGRLQTQHYPSGLKTHNLYDAQGALSAVYRYDRSVLPGTGQSSSYRTLATHFTNQAATQRTNSTTHLQTFTAKYAEAQDHWDSLPGIKAHLDEQHQLWLDYTALADASQAEANAALLPFDRPIPIIVDDITSFFYLHMPNGDPILHQQKQAEADAYYAQAATAKTEETTFSNQLNTAKTAAINSYSAGQLAELEYHAAISAAKRYEVIAQGYTTSANLIDGGASPLEPNPLSIANDVDAAGRIKQFALGNGLTSNRRYDQAHGFLTDITTGNTGTNGWTVQSLAFDYDEIGNLKQRKNHLSNKTEVFNYDGVNRLDDVTEGSQTFDYNYAINGNISEKDGYIYDYSGTSSGPHAVDSRTKTDASGTHLYNYLYDANGNQTTATGPSLNRSITWTDFNKPRRINNNSAQLDFVYSPAHSRLKQTAIADTALAATTTKTILYLGAGYEQIINPDGELEHKHHIAVPGATVIDTQKGDGTSSTQYSLSDHLGSTDVVVGIDPTTPAPNPGEHPQPKPQETQRLSFGPFGESRDPVTHDPREFDDSQTSRGYTGHEMLNLVGLIHMNGRIYDPALGRMLSADPNIQAPASVQNHNRYSYVNNNPLSYTDPSGYFFKKLFKAVLIAVAAYYGGLAIANAFGGGVVLQGAAMGFIAGGLSTGTLRGALIGALIGGVSAGFSQAIGGLRNLGPIARAAAHGITQGMIGMARGDSFRSGFASAFMGSIVPINRIGAPGSAGIPARMAAAAMVGGTVSVLSGGKFANGAMTAGFVRLFNHEHHGSGAGDGTSEHPMDKVAVDLTGNPIASNELAAPYFEGDSRITSPFGQRSNRYHLGVDVVPLNPDGSVCHTCVVNSGTDGLVIHAGNARGFGTNTVVIATPGGDQAVYGHMQGIIPGISVGSQVSAGQAIGIVGNEGFSSGTHLHVEFRQGTAAFRGLRMQASSISMPKSYRNYEQEIF